MPEKASPLNYRKLIALELRDNFNYFMIGFVTVALFFISGIYLLTKYVRLPSFPKKAVTKNQNSTSKTAVKTYVVKEGDTLALISQSVYGSTDYAGEIAKANNLKDPNNIEIGVRLILPQINSKKNDLGQIATSVQTSQVTFKGDKYTVQENDLLWDIAVKAYGDGNMWVKIAKANNLPNPDSITTGMVLNIPRN